MRAWLVVGLLFIIPCRAWSDPGKDCKRDLDCKVAESCLGCGQCFSKPPTGPRGIDCEAECAVPAGTSCACVKGACEVKKLDAPRYLRATDGRQCELSKDNTKATQQEKSRLQTAGVAVEELSVSSVVRSDFLPAACVPADVEAFWKMHPEAAEGVKKSQGMVCEACGCPETWFYCVGSTSGAAALRKAGYAAVK